MSVLYSVRVVAVFASTCVCFVRSLIVGLCASVVRVDGVHIDQGQGKVPGWLDGLEAVLAQGRGRRSKVGVGRRGRGRSEKEGLV